MSDAGVQTLNDVCEFIVDCLHKTAPTQEEGFPLIRTPNIGKGRLKLDNALRVSEDTYRIWTQRAVPEEGDLILAREAPAGNVAVVKNGEQVCLGQRTVHLRPDRQAVDPDFLCYFLLTPPKQAALLAGETGATAKHVNMKDIRRLPLPDLPDLDTQKKISNILTPYDDLIENNRRRIQLLEESARLLYREWFVYLRFPGHEHVKVVEGVPEGWGKSTVGELTEQIKSTVKPKDIDPEEPYIGLEHIPRRAITLGDWGRGADVTSGKYRFQENDILFGKIRPYFHKVGFALTEGVASSDAIVVRAKDREMQPLVLACMSSDQFVAVASKTVREGSKMPRADWSVLQEYPVLIPNGSLLEEFNSFMNPILKQLKNLTFTNKRLAEARDLLLPRLMNGEIAV